ncbi:MAG: zinc ribbon domain-containing protein, partial [Acidobacteriota bacterium]|nr:zinc ribbon domain-containing protein [Acidobacteriota bacterium]
MFCPKCGSNQSDGKKFCTVCGTNLLIVSQALTGQLPQPPVHYAPPVISPHEIERQQEMKKGITMAVLGGGYIVYKIISFIFSFPFYGWRSPFGFWSFVAFFIFAVGISKVIGSRMTAPATTALNPANMPANAAVPPRAMQPQPVFSGVTTSETAAAPHTSELKLGKRPTVS